MELNRGLLTLIALLIIGSITIATISLTSSDFDFNESTQPENVTTQPVCEAVNQSFDNRTMYYDEERKVCIDPETNKSWTR